MKTYRHLLLAAAALSLATASSAQTAITITNTGFPTTLPATDTAAIVSNVGSFANLGTAATNANWDISTATYTGPTYFDRAVPTNTAFPNATYRGNLFTTFAGGLQYVTAGYYTLSGSGISRIGEEVRTRQALSLMAVSGGMNDSVIFPVQTIAYTGGSTPDLIFPATIGTNWTSSVGSTLNFNLTVALAGLNNAPGERRILRTANDTVVGWGRMRVLNEAAGQASGWMNVLQVRSRATVRDSFFLNGAPAPAQLLAPFNIQQGQLTSVTYVRFYRASEHWPLADLRWDAASSAGAPARMAVSQMRLPSAASISGVDAADAVTLFPNPVRGNAVHVKLPAGIDFRYQVLSVTGTVAADGSLKATAAGEASIALKEAPAGIYYLVLASENTGRLVLPFEVE